MPEPSRSPKQSRAAARFSIHPYNATNVRRTARDVGGQGSQGLFGSIKSFVKSFLPSGDSANVNGVTNGDSSHKRRVSFEDRSSTPPRAVKRPRRRSPESDEEEPAGYLDPPRSLLSLNKQTMPFGTVANGVHPTRIVPIDQPQPPIDAAEIPLPPSRGVSRASMSIEPIDHMAVRRSTTRDRSMPPPSPFARSFTRYSATPQPAGATFGPSPKRRTRDASAPPTISVPAVPTFTRPPTSSLPQSKIFARQPSRERSEGPIMSLLSQTRQSMSPIREPTPSGMLSAMDTSIPRSPSKAERALATLETYRTPLHPTEYPSTRYPPERRPRKVHVPAPPKFGFDHLPSGKKRRTSIVQPYSSEMSGMRKLLQRKKQELEQVTKELEGVADDIKEVISPSEDKETRMENKEDVPQPVQISDKVESIPPRSSKAESYNGLRAPRDKVTLAHSPAPRARNKFSLRDEDDEEPSLTVKELKNFKATAAPPPLRFGLTRSMSEAGMQTDTSTETETPRAVTPPLPAQSQSFNSLLSRIGPAVTKPSAEFPPEPKKVDSEVQVQSVQAEIKPDAPLTALPFSFGAATAPLLPKPSDIPNPFTFGAPPTSNASLAPSFPGEKPSFFSNTKMQFTPPSAPAGSLFGAPSTNGTSRLLFGATATNGIEKTAEQEKQIKPLPFGGISKPSGLAPTTAPFSAPSSATTSISEFASATTPTTEAAKTTFSFGAPAAEVPKPLSLFDTPPKAPETPTKETTAFGSGLPTPSPSAELSESSPSKPAFSFGAPSMTPTFSFGVSTTPKAPETTTAAAPSPFTFESAPSTPTAQEKKGLVFGSPTPFVAVPTATAETPKQQQTFGGFGSPATVAPSTPKAAESKLDNGDSMETGGDRMEESPTRTIEKKEPSAFGFPQQTSAFPSFGSGSSSSGGFTFGQPKTEIVTTTSTFSFGAPKTETTTTLSTFSFGAPTDKAPTATNSPFSFGAPKSASTGGFSFGQPAATATSGGGSFAFGAKPAEQPSTLFGQPSTASPFGTPPATSAGSTFSFGQPANAASTTPFGQPKVEPTGTAPSSPFLAQQPLVSSPSFSFSAPSASPFGAPQPAGGATPSSPSIQPFQFGASTGAPQAAPTMFNIGAAPTTQTPPGQRRMKGLPTRRKK